MVSRLKYGRTTPIAPVFSVKPMPHLSAKLSNATPRNVTVLISGASALWLIGAPVVGRLVWSETPWILVLLFAAMAELLVLTAWLLGSTLHDPVKRWELPPNPADAQRGWRGALARTRELAQTAIAFVRSRWPRRPTKS